KARIAALQSETNERAAMIEKLRAELAAANERLALQAARFRDEVRQIRPGAPPGREETKAEARRSLAQRITDANPALAATLRSGPYGTASRRAAGETAAERTDGKASEAPSPQPVNGLSTGPTVTQAEGKDNGRAPEAAATDAASPGPDAQPRSRLLDRLASIGKP